MHNRCPFVSEDTRTFVGDNGTVFLPVRNKTRHENITIQSRTVLGKAELTTFVFEPTAVEQPGGASASFVEQTNRFHAIDLNDTSSQFSSFAQTFYLLLSCLREAYPKTETRKRTDPKLLNSIAFPNLFLSFRFGGRGEGPTRERNK